MTRPLCVCGTGIWSDECMTRAHTHGPRMAETNAATHGSDFRRWLTGEWVRCVCGHSPRDNALLIAHFAEHGFREVEDHGRIIRKAVGE